MDFIVENNKHFPRLKEYFKRNAQVYQYIYATLFPKYLCRVNDHRVKRKVALILPTEARKISKKIYILFVKWQ